MEEPERYFENAFLVNCDRFTINIDFPANVKMPTISEVNLETEEVKKSRVQLAATRSGDRLIARWTKKDVTPGLSFRLQG